MKPKVLILGGGFAGLYAARALKRAPVEVTLLDARNHHLFQPLLYQVATAGLSPADIAAPLRRILRHQANVEVLLGEAVHIDTEAQRVTLRDGAELAYDYLVVATGASHAYFGHPEYEPLAPGLKSVEDAVEIRRRALTAFERAELQPDDPSGWLTFVIVGAGPTGVEMAGAIAELARQTLHGEFHHIDPRRARVILVEGLPQVLPTYPRDLSRRAERQLERLGVEVRLNTKVTCIEPGVVCLGDHRIRAHTVVWAAGVRASPLGEQLGAPLDRAGRVEVRPDLSVPGAPNVFVAGDLARALSDGKPVPGVAPAAIQEGRHVAHNLRRLVRGQPTLPFHYRDKGALATIGRSAAVADLGRMHLSGFVAWIAWLVIHILFLIGFRNRLVVLIDWAWAYVTRQRNARLIADTAWAERLRTDEQQPHLA